MSPVSLCWGFKHAISETQHLHEASVIIPSPPFFLTEGMDVREVKELVMPLLSNRQDSDSVLVVLSLTSAHGRPVFPA